MELRLFRICTGGLGVGRAALVRNVHSLYVGLLRCSLLHNAPASPPAADATTTPAPARTPARLSLNVLLLLEVIVVET
jgi:hypothetical protein